MFIRHFVDLVILMAGGLTLSTAFFGVLWVRARDRASRAEALLEGMRMNGSRSDTSPAIDAIAEEVERIGEGQRFLTRLMSEQANRANVSAPRMPGSITPH